MFPGRLYSWGIGTSNLMNNYGTCFTSGRLYAYPIFIPHMIKIDQFNVYVQTPQTGARVRVGIYDSKQDGTIFPDKLIVDGEIDVSAMQTKSVTITPTRLYPGIHWLAIIANDVNLQMYECQMGPHFFGVHGIEQYGSGGSPEQIFGVYADGQSYGALASTFPSLAGWISYNTITTYLGPWIALRVLPDPDTIYPFANVPLALSISANVIVGDQGYVAEGSYYNEIDRFQFASETCHDVSATLPDGQRDNLAACNSSTRGYWMGGGWVSNNRSWIDGIQFSDETAINPSAALVLGRRNLAAVNSSSKGYCGGGRYENPSTTTTTEIDGIQFSNESQINPSAALALTRADMASFGSSTRGYWAGGCDYNWSTNYNEIDGIQYSDETAQNPSAVLAVTRRAMAGVNSNAKGYAGGGFTTGVVNDIDGLNFSDETQIDPAATLNAARNNNSGVNSTAKGYWIGGYNGTSATGEIDGINFSDETGVNPSAALSTARYTLAGCQSGGIL
jgi:hypothetical protein